MMNQPPINYRDVIINKKNVNSFLQSQTSGLFCPEDKCIYMYRYSVDKSIHGDQRRMVKSVIRGLQGEYDKTLAHETHHYIDVNAVDFDAVPGNYYEESLLYPLEEASAFTAGYLYTEPELVAHGVCPKTVMCAMLLGVSDFAQYSMTRFYIQHHMDTLAACINDDLEEYPSNLVPMMECQKLYRENPYELLSDNFYAAIQTFFTYEDVCILGQDPMPEIFTHAWQSILPSFKLICDKYMCNTYRVINKVLRQHGC